VYYSNSILSLCFWFSTTFVHARDLLHLHIIYIGEKEFVVKRVVVQKRKDGKMETKEEEENKQINAALVSNQQQRAMCLVAFQRFV
jgi:hypothetical protein